MSAPSNVHPRQDRFRGALLGTLMGDALGMPWEGWTAGRIREAAPRNDRSASGSRHLHG
jgi:ADP-ribosylglycohydrolase